MDMKNGKTSKKINILICILMVLAIITFSYAQFNQNFAWCLTGVVLLFICNVILGLKSIKTRFLFLIFQIPFFTFLVSRPFIGIITKVDGWMGSGQQKGNIVFAFILVFLSLFFMQIGAVGMDSLCQIQRKKCLNCLEKTENEFVYKLQFFSLMIFGVTMIFYMIVQIEPLLFMRGKTYIEFYSEYKSELPGYFHTIASFMKYSLCIFLATMPRKKLAIVPLILYVLSAIPMLFIGVRNPFMLNCLFVMIYFFVRDIKKSKEKWIGAFEKAGLIISTPFVLAFMSVYSFIRSQSEVQELNFFKQVFDFFYQQGTTFNALQIAYGYREGIKSLNNHYTFGGMLDYIKHGTVGQKIWGSEPLPSGNCEINGIYSNSLAHNLSYISMKEDYLSGRGRGSSYLLETYFDWGYVGVILFSVFLGALFIFFLYRFGHNVLESTIILVSLTSIYFIPRAEATGWLTFIVTVQFWICIAVCYMGAYVCKKISICRNIKKS